MLLYAGILGAVAWTTMGFWGNWALLSLSLVGFGLAWVLIQPVLVNAAQQLMPRQKGTVMSLVSFNMFVGGAIGTLLFGYVQSDWGFSPVFVTAAVLMLAAGILGTAVLNRIKRAASIEYQANKAEAEKQLQAEPGE
jgi:predicted MFS family arabinose efflux permease